MNQSETTVRPIDEWDRRLFFDALIVGFTIGFSAAMVLLFFGIINV